MQEEVFTLKLILVRDTEFQKNHATKWLECEKWSRKALDGKCDGYMWGLGGAKKCSGRALGDNCAQIPSESTNSEKPM